MFFASLRLALAFCCVGGSLILTAHWLGYLPDPALATKRARQSISEAIAINAASHIRTGQWVDLRGTLQKQVDRDPNLLSVGVRSKQGFLRADTSHHAEFWPIGGEFDPSVEAVKVPVTLNRRPWGEVELAFRQPHTTAFAKTMHAPVVRLLAFFMICGVFVYTIFVIRFMRLLNGTQVVPNRVKQALDTLAEGLLVLDDTGRIVLANQAFANMVGSDSNKLSRQSANELNWIGENVTAAELPWTRAVNETELQSEAVIQIQLADGSQRIFSVNAAPLGTDGTHRGALATFRDVTHVEEHRAELEQMLSLLRTSRDEIKRKNRELEILATQDALTGCLNRRAFFEGFESHWKEAQATAAPLACIMIDIDHFKNVNDTYGHHTGDEVLRQVSKTVHQLHCEDGLVCRYGGEEFCVLLPHYDLNQALQAAEKTRAAISVIRLSETAELRLTASLGVSELRFKPSDPQDLINQADICLYVAKREGRNRVISYYERIKTTIKNEEALKARREKVNIPYQAVTALMTTLSYRDAKTAEHSRRVADLCGRFSAGLLDPAKIYLLEIAALLHDIGKIGVPDDILLKPGPLSAEEWEFMGRHDRIGVEIIACAFECPELSSIIANHHAFYGGAGRDSSLPTGDKIPVCSRILAIADSYDAMVSDRAYRKGRTHEEAIKELRRCAGTQFDPSLVEQFAEKINNQSPVLMAGAMSLRKITAIEIGHQVERLANAAQTRNLEELQTLASSLGKIGKLNHVYPIVQAAERIQSADVAEEQEWLNVLRDTHNLLDVCHATQSQFLRESLESASGVMHH
ncbi:MAG: diguanylate cyclase [Rubripirellula sp.]|nr:diguanylate cyclase [Rubripirellula sp.]